MAEAWNERPKMSIYANFNRSEDVWSLQQDLYSLQKWVDIWQLKISLEKCNVSHIGQTNQKHQYTINGNILSSVQSVKDLGVNITSDLSSSTQCSYIVKKASRVAHLILKAFTSKDVHLMTQAFKTYARPILEYCSIVWSPHTIGDINKVEKVQRSFTKKVLYETNLTYTERLSLLGLERL